jgi:NTE family protein
MTTAFVLQGGGSLAAAQVGMLRALCEAGIVPDLVVGSSAGAINAVSYAHDPTPHGLDQLEALWAKVRRGTVFPINALDIVNGLIGRRNGVASPRRLRALLERCVGDRLLEDSPVPVHVIATDVATGEPVTLSSGPALEALLASTAMPGVFPPVPLDGRLLADGGVAADTPVLQAEELGATVTYVLPAVAAVRSLETARGAVAHFLRAVSHVYDRAAATDVTAARGRVHVLPAPTHHEVNPFDFRLTGTFVREGYAVARARLLAGEPAPASAPRRLAVAA